MPNSQNCQIILATVIAIGLCTAVFAKPAEKKPSSKPEVNDKEFHAALLQAAAEYKSAPYKQVTDSPALAPALCAMARLPAGSPGPQLSSSKDESTHGRKVYFLFAKDAAKYTGLFPEGKTPVGQVIVKESWVPQMINGQPLMPPLASTEKNGLFIIMRMDPATPKTDEGWVYGTVTADGTTVTSAGRVQSCMTCHTDARYERLFGLKSDITIPSQFR